MLTATTISNYENVRFEIDSEMPYLLNIVQLDQYWMEQRIGRFNFYAKEGFLVLLNGKRKEYKSFSALLNNFFKYDEYFGWNSKVVEQCKEEGLKQIKADKKAAEAEYKEMQSNKALDFLNKINNKDENTVTILQAHNNKTDEEIISLINNTFKGISKQLTNEILIAIKSLFTPVVEVEQTEQTTTENNIQESFTVGNRTFSTYQEAEAYCTSSDFDPELMIIKESANTGTPINPNNETTDQQPEIFHLYKDTFTTYSEAYNHAIINQIPVTMIISNKHETMTTERLQELEKEYIFNKSNMSIDDMNEYYNYLSSLPETLDQQERYYKLKSRIDRYYYQQQQREQREAEQKQKAIAIDDMLKDLYSIGMTNKEYTSLMIYYLNGEQIYSWSSGISTEKMYSELLEVYNRHYKQLQAV